MIMRILYDKISYDVSNLKALRNSTYSRCLHVLASTCGNEFKELEIKGV